MEVTETAVIPRPPAAVFAAAADPLTQLKWDPDTLKRVEALGEGPLAKGSRYRGEFKGFGTVEYEFTEFDPPRRFEHLARVKAGTMRHTLTFEEVPEGTRLTQVGRLEPNLLGRLMGPMLKRGFRQRFQTIAKELTDYLA
jgi:uncharacterized protein YndB with AHSA1/START domain